MAGMVQCELGCLGKISPDQIRATEVLGMTSESDYRTRTGGKGEEEERLRYGILHNMASMQRSNRLLNP